MKSVCIRARLQEPALSAAEGYLKWLKNSWGFSPSGTFFRLNQSFA